MKYEVYKVTEPMLKSGLTALVNCSYKECEKYIAKHGYKTADDGIDHSTAFGVLFHLAKIEDPNDKAYLLWQRHFDWTIADMGVFVHELLHFAVSILDDKGIAVRVENDEVLAYLQEYYVVRFFEQLKVHSRKMKRRKGGGKKHDKRK